MKKIYELVKTYDIQPVEVANGESLNFRIEIFSDIESSIYFGKVYRLETFRLQPTFPQIDGSPPNWAHDGLVYTVDDMFDANKLKGGSIGEVVDSFKKLLTHQLG